MNDAYAGTEEARLWAAYADLPGDPAVVGALITALKARGAEIPPDLAEREIILQRQARPEDPGLVRAHIAALVKQGKPVPPDLEELSLKQILADDPESAPHVMALVSLYLRTGKPVAPELEKKALTIALAERPDDPELLRALAAVEAKLSAPASANRIFIRSVPKSAPAPSSLEAALGTALSTRPADTYLLALLLGAMIESGRITPASRPDLVLSQLPPQVQTNEAIIAALLMAAGKTGNRGV